MYDVIWSNWQTQKMSKRNKSCELTEGFQQTVSAHLSSLLLAPPRSSPAPGFLPHFSFLLPSPASPHSPYYPPHPPTLGGENASKELKGHRLLISRGLSRQRIGCLRFSSAVHGLLTVFWSWACVVKNRRKKPGRHTLMPHWRSWTGLQWGLSSKWGRWLVFNNWE